MKFFKFLLLTLLFAQLATFDCSAQQRGVIISILVKDEATKLPQSGVNISYFNKKGQLINCSQPTNAQGRLDFEAPDFKPGEKITVIADKPGLYIEKEETLRILGYGGNENQISFELRSDAGREVNIKIVDTKKQKPVVNAIIRYKNVVGKIEEKRTDKNGEARFPIFNRVGREVEFNIQREGAYPQIRRATVGEDGIDLSIQMEYQSAFTFCDLMPYAAGTFAVLSGGMYLGSRKFYQNSKNFKNLTRLNEYAKANTFNRVAKISAGMAGAALVGWLICNKKKKDREKERNHLQQRTGLVPSFSPTSPDDLAYFQIGMIYKF